MLDATLDWRYTALDESAWVELEQFKPSPCLLPRLRSLLLTINCSVALVPVHILVSPILEQLNVYGRYVGLRKRHLQRGLQRLSDKLHSTNPPISHLTLEFYHGNCPKYQAVFNALLCLRSLTTVNTSHTPVGSSMVATLSHLPHLRDLQVHASGLGLAIIDAFSRFRSTRPFPSLAKVSFTTRDMAAAHCLLRSVSSRCLTYIDIGMQANISSQDAEEFTLIVALHHPLLEHLALRLLDPMSRHLDDPDEAASDQVPLPAEILAPLFGLSKLSKLNMASCPIVVNDSLVARMAMAWPHLVSLELCSSFNGFDYLGVRPPAHVRLMALVPLFESCKKLQRLGLPLDTRMNTSRTAYSDRDCGLKVARPTVPRFTELCVGWSKIEEQDIAAVASFLSEYLPALSKVTEGWGSAFVYNLAVTDEDAQGAVIYEARWEQVEALVRALRVVREQERNWALRAKMSAVPDSLVALDGSQGWE